MMLTMAEKGIHISETDSGKDAVATSKGTAQDKQRTWRKYLREDLRKDLRSFGGWSHDAGHFFPPYVMLLLPRLMTLGWSNWTAGLSNKKVGNMFEVIFSNASAKKVPKQEAAAQPGQAGEAPQAGQQA